MVLNTEWAQVEVIDLINDGSGLAFGIIGGRSTGVVVKTILPGGVADRDGRLQSGDHILQIGEVNLRGLGSEQVASVLRQCGVHVRMVVARPVESTTAEYQALGSHAPIVPTKILGDPVELDRHLIENGYAETLANQQPPSNYSTPFIYTGQQSDIQLHPISGIVDIVKDPLPIGNAPLPSLQIQVLSNTKMLPLDMALQKPDLPETEVYNVELKKDDLGLGITVAGYVCEKEEISGVFVKSISKGSAADLVKNIRINDRIIEVDGISVIGFTNHQAVELLRNTGSLVTIKLERYLRGPKFEQLQQAIRANELRPASPPSPSASSLQKVPLSLVHMSYLGIEPEMESRTSLDVDSTILLDGLNEEREIVIDGSVERRASGMSSLEYVVKWREIFDEDVQIVVARMHKEPNSGLGISLEGTVDVEDGREVRPHHYIRNILPDGPVGRNGILQSGDELLEVNEHQLLGLNHMDVVAILKRLPDYVCFVCARYLVPTMARVIDTSQRIEAFQARKILAGSLQTLIPSNENRMVKAKSETSIASSAASGAITGSRSRSLELVAGLPMWSEEATVVELNKGDNGLGFSILDYQDPLNSSQTVIVIRSLVPGGVAQTDGRLIPGDRLLAVNDINVEHATLDRAVQVLKAAQKGTVKITVAKPLTTNDSNISHDTEDDQTCFDEFQECLEEYEECLELVQICIDDDRSFNYSPCTSQVEDFGQKTTDAQDNNLSHIFENTYLQLTMLKKTSMDDSDLDISFKSTNGNQLDNNKLNELDNKKCLSNCAVIKNNNNKNQKTASLVLNKSDSLTQSDKVSNITQSSNLSEKDGYETCIDESLSEDSAKLKTTILATTPTKNQETETATDNDNHNKVQKTNDDPEEITPTNSKINILDQLFIEVPDSTQPPTPATASLTTTITLSEPCLNTNPFNSPKHICLDTKYDDGLKSYDNRNSGGDEFFLVQYPEDNTKEVSKCSSEPNVLETVTDVRKGVYRRCLREYYNDYEDCLEALAESKDVGKEVNEDDIFSDILLPFKSRSAPDIMDSSFVMLTYDPGPELRNRRKSAFVAGYQTSESEYPLQMTVIRPIDNEYGTLKGIHVDNMLEKHWGSTHTVEVYREPNKSLGISIVGGKVDLNYSEKSTDTVLGIFVKNVVPNSPAGKTGHLKTGDRILEVSGVDLRQANHETAVQAIRNASNPVQFVVQSIIPWKSQIEDTNDTTCPSPFPSPVSKAPPQTFNVELQETVIPPPPAPPSVVITDEDTLPSQKVLSKNESYEGSDDDEDEDDVRDLEGRTVSDKGHQIDRASAANFKRSKEEIDADPDEEDDYGYTMNKVKKKYASLGHTILMVQLERSNQGLGLSLAGHKDRNCMAVFVCGLNPTGMAYKTGGIQIGDEILEVNGVVLHGRCHLNASAIIKGLSGPIFKVIVLRRKTAIDDIAVKPITQFPVSLAEEASEEQFSASYPNVRTIAIKKQGNQSLGIMIIEGKHAEVGQGIFISDIQEGSSAEKAGLEIGEMILAVNKDTLVGSNYDTAANLLKRTEGLVTLVVSNPGKKDYAIPPPSNAVEPTIHKSNALKPTVQPSRPTTPVPEPPADPTTCQVTPGKDSVIEITTDNKGLGICFVGGKDTLLPTGIIVVEVYPGGTAEKDGRLQPGDQIIDVNGTSLKDVTNTTASQALRQTLPKVKLTIFRPNKIEYTVIDVDLMKKPGKAIGLSVVAKKSGKGVYVADIINGSAADVDGRIIKGDLLISVNGQNVESATAVEAGAILKTVMGKVSLKLHRYKPIAR